MKGNSKKGSKAPRGQPGSGERRVPKQTLQDSKELLGRVLHSLSDAVFILDAATTEILECNPAACEIFGHGRGEMVGQTTAFLHVDEAALEEFRRRLYSAIEEKGFLHEFQFRMKRKDGSVFPTEHNVTPLIGKDGRRVGWVSVVHDITKRKQTETKYTAIVETALDGFWIIDLEGRFLDVNDSYCQMIGYTREELLTMSIPDIRAVKEPKVTTRIKKIVEQGYGRFETRHRRKDGQIIDIEISARYSDVNGGQIVVFVRDITERKRSEETLRQSEENFKALAENASDGILITWAEGGIAYANRQAVEITGYSVGELLEANVKQLAYPGDIKKLLRRYKDRLEGKPVPSRYETFTVRKGGEAVPTETAAAVTTWQGKPATMFFIRDITERKRAEEALQESEAWFRGIYEDSPIAIELFDSDGRLIGVNKACMDMFGQRNDTKLKWFKLLEDPYLPENVKRRVRAGQISKYGTRWDFEEVKRLKLYETTRSGVAHLDVMVSPLGGSEGELLRGYVVRIQDITERKRAEEALMVSEQRFRSLAEQSPNMIFINVKGRIVYANDRCEEVMGYKKDEFYSPDFDFLTLIAPEFRELVRSSFSMHMESKEALPYEYALVTKDGKRIQAILITRLIDYGGESAILGTVIDLTKLKLVEEALRESEVKYRSLFEEANDAILIADTESGEIVDANREAERLLGLSRKEIIGMNRSQIHPLEKADYYQEHFKKHIEAGRIVDFNAEVVRKDGTVVPVCISANTLQLGGKGLIQGIFRDVTERKRAEDALRESEIKYAALVEQAADGVVIAQDGIIKFANNGLAQITGYSVAELVGMSFLDSVDSSSRDVVAHRYAMRMAGTPISVALELRMLCRDGTVKEVEARPTTIQYQGRPAVLSIVRDVTERRRAEEELQRKEEFYRSLIENASDAMAIINADGTVCYQSPSYRQALGYVPEEETGRSLFDNMHQDDIAWVSEDFARLLQDPSYTSHFELRVRFRDGSWHTIEGVSRNLLNHPAVKGIVVNFRDVTERKKAQEALWQSEQRLQLIFDSVAEGLAVVNLQGTIVEANQGLADMHGFRSKEQLIGKGMADLLDPRENEQARISIRKIIEEGADRNVEYTLVRADGSPFTGEINTSLLKDAENNPIGFISSTRDITERKRAEQKLQEALEKETEARQKLEEEMKKRVEFTRALVHELKTPLTSVIASSELLALELPQGPLLRMAKNINSGANDLNMRIDELLDVARGELGMLKLSFTSVDPLRMLRGLAENMGPVALSRHQSLVLYLPPALLPVWADETRLRQVVLNLLSNACKFTGEGGKITLKAGEEGDRLIVEVEDTGPGLREAEQRRLFTAYYRGEGDRERFSGLGLGLSLCKMLVELHGGQIWVRSQPGKGSTFGFSVPLVKANQQGEEAEGEEE